MTDTPLADDRWHWISEPEAKAVLASRGIPVPRGQVVATPAEASHVSEHLHFPLALKVVAEGLVHKSDVGGVRLGLTSAESVADAALDMLSTVLSTVRDVQGGDAHVKLLVEEQHPGGIEIAIGAHSAVGFGPVVMVGLGGVLVEQFDDVVFCFAPATAIDVERALRRLRAWPILAGTRGAQPIDIAGLAGVVAAVGELAVDLQGQEFQIDLNPVIARPDGVIAVDAAIGTRPLQTPLFATGLDKPALDLQRLFRPERVAIAGADPRRPTLGNMLLRENRRAGLEDLIAIHPDAATIESVEGVATVTTIDRNDCVHLLSITGAEDVTEATIAANAASTAIHLFTGPFTADPSHRLLWKQRVLDAAYQQGSRILGPNAMGIHSPSRGLSFVPGSSLDPSGRVGAVLQSGGLATELVNIGEDKGIRFSTVVSAGDAMDIGIDELVGHLLQDSQTDVLGLYVETAAFARGILDNLRAHPKPLVLLPGGRTVRGAAAAASHTQALAADSRLWSALAAETGSVLVDSLEDMATSLQFLQTFGRSEPKTPAGALVIGTGGDGVIGSDILGANGIALQPLNDAAASALAALAIPGVGLANPIDLAQLGALLNRPSGDGLLDQIVGTVLDHQTLSDVVVLFGVTSLFAYFPRPDTLLHRLIDMLTRLPSRHPDTRFTVAVLASGVGEDGGRTAARELSAAGLAVVRSIREAAIGLRAIASP